ncbi:MAG TPA: DnaA/Hda family protein [Elusimicrobiales bacterium]|nr:DnaA/Hda family protein [Elusimicrobiales bacterium]
MISRWQIVKPSDKTKQRYLLFFDGVKKDLSFVYQKLTPFVDSAKYAQKPYSFCLFLKDINPETVDRIKKIMSILTEITKKTTSRTKPDNLKVAKKDDFFSKIQSSLFGLAKAKEGAEVSNPKYLEDEVPDTQNWQVVGDEAAKKQLNSDEFFSKLEKQLAEMGKEKGKTTVSESDSDKNIVEETKEKPVLDFDFAAEMLFGKKSSKDTKADKAQQKKEEKTQEKTENKIPKEIEKPDMQVSQINASDLKAEKTKTQSEEIKHFSRFEFKNSKKDKFLLLAPLNPGYTFDSFFVTTENRNLHALAVSVAENPGGYDNPFTIFGSEQTGKTHLLNSIYNVLVKKLSEDSVLFTTGIRVSTAVSRMSGNENLSKFDRQMKQFKAVLIDDISGMVITEKNKNFLVSFFNYCKEAEKQLIFTSRFTKEKLESIFSEWSFDIPFMTSAEIKPLQDKDYKKVLGDYIESCGFKSEQKDDFLTTDAASITFKDIDRFSVLRNMMSKFPDKSSEIINLITDRGKGFYGMDQRELGKASLFKLPEENTWGRWGVFYQKGTETYAKYALYSLYERAKELGINGGWENVFLQPYDSANTKFFPAQMAQYSLEENVNAVVVIGPPSEHKFFENTSLFFSILRNACNGIGLSCGCIGHNELAYPGAYARLLADLLM